MSALSWVSAGDLPQDPYYPQFPPKGPSFLDTEACLCALRPADPTRPQVAGWQCIGNQTQGVYNVTTGKWFAPLHDSAEVGGRVDDASNGPNTAKALRWDRNNKSFSPDDGTLGVYDKACTGQNQTTFSTAFYRAAEQQKDKKPMIDAAPCWRQGAVPMQIQTVESWQKDGCSEGFLCKNNTVNSLPQFCPPLTVCQQSRLAGDACALDGITVGMGPFEPVVCPAGYYCPKGGKEMIRCPERSYCQPGASAPTPCSVGSRCPEGASFEVFLIPLGILVIIDGLLIIGIVLLTLRARGRKRKTSPGPGILKTSMTLGGGIKRAMTRYRALSEERDQESLPMDATYYPRDGTWGGFQDVMHMAELQGRPIEEMKDELPVHLRGFVESMRKATDASRLGLSFAYSGLQFHPRKAQKPILQGVTGSIERGTLTAVMGGSGAGKSTFVRLLMGKITNTGGAVMVNNSPGRIKRYKKLIGYVPQDDIVLPELTVYENILHSAQIRLPRTWTPVEIESHVNSVIECLELSHVRDSLVGSVGKPVISGGQRKRVSIGMELAAAPMSIFLDEPTSGLDATSAVSMMRTLQAIARLGLSIIVIIHQPRMEIFEMLDSLILLGNGQLLYEGPEKGVQRYFENLGFNFPDHCNAGDVVTDIITGNGRIYKKSGDVSKESLIAHWASASANKNSAEGKHPRDKHGSVLSLATSDNSAIHQALKKRGAPYLKQMVLCFRRAMLQQYRTKTAFFFEMGLSSLAGFLIGLAVNGKKGVMFKGFYKAPYDVLSIAADFQAAPEFALLTAIAIGLSAASPAVRVFSEETLLYRREAEAGHSRISYYLAKIAAVIPRMALSCLHLTTFLIALAHPGGLSWGTAFITNLAYIWAIYGLAAVVSMVARREDAPLFATILSLVVGILSGAAPSLAQVRDWGIVWLWRASPGTWFAELYFGQMVFPFAYLYQVDLAAQATGFSLNRLWLNVLVIFCIGLLYRVIAFIGLVVGHRLRI